MTYPGPALAQTATNAAPSANGARTTIYDAAFFAPFAPRTALDIARRVPGFTLDLGTGQGDDDADVRGFAGTAGNVVFNGARPSSKAESLETLLARIPAQRVVRVEVGSGDLFGSDYSGKSQVINIVMSAEAGVDANITASVQRRYEGTINSDISASALLRRGASTINVSAGTGRNHEMEEGTDTVTGAVAGEFREFRRKFNDIFNRDPYVAGSWALERESDNALRFNARWQPSRLDLFQRNRVTPANGAPHDDVLVQRYRRPVIEVGGDITRPLAGGAMKLVALATRRKRTDFEAYDLRDGLESDGATTIGGYEQTLDARRDETIGRVSWTRSNLAGFSVEAGAEAALNTLDSSLLVYEIDENGEKIPIDLNIKDAQVRETRGELFFSAGRNLSPALRIDGGVNVEFSRLKVRGDAQADRKLRFLKPNLAVDWKFGGGWHSRLSVRRTVAQLDFYDFVSAVQLSTDQFSAGNENLQPQRTWEVRLLAERPILGDGLIKLDLGHDRVSMLQDRILIFDEDGKGFDAPGNLGRGTRSFATLTIDAPLSRLWSGLRAKFDATVQRTRVEDPISGEDRNFSGFFPDWTWRVDVRRDADRWSYGLALDDRSSITFFRTDEFDANFNGRPYTSAFAEFRPSARSSITFDVDNLLESVGSRSRRLFSPNRAEPTDIEDEFRERNRHASFRVTLKHSFGGGAAASPGN
ncbi:outer membrane beta-barrel protein [Sphingomonas sinipercae]|uniref:Outer membrane beta-barrel protein n=1 Tax=Sphingomonas sinipercae TaxID=2714944 RepID=A0A6G7ZNF5_9SPHN|nr:outer membrane beta-barrel protein [Sphingomonas sinipercae]QIL02514.1 outer membrane beta-barrel protein [Sphingomonas sinipercae]